MINQIPLIIPNFNLLTYTKNLVNWWHFYYPENKVIVIDNGSTYGPLLDWYENLPKSVTVVKYQENKFRDNLKDYLSRSGHEYYVISDPDIMPHPTTPAGFLETFKYAIDNEGYHHAGFQLITEDLPAWLHKREEVIYNENQLRGNPVIIQGVPAHKAPIDTTFALYTQKNKGWESPMPGHNWSNSVRMFKAFHLPWYLHGMNLNPEMIHYYSTVKKHITGEPSAGSNNYRPKEYE